MFNLTLFIQGLNFLAAYLLLAKFFFKPVLNVIDEQLNSEKFIVKAIEHCHETLNNADLKRQQLWQDAYGEFHKYIDFDADLDFKSKAYDRQILNDKLEIEFDIKSCDQLVRVLADKIIISQSVGVK